ncbi:uncharacterized protein F4812DRAFT_462239 [Daldinia caldariorum]|uniref:uncharacterized protein n=1 Tax=Daldinia caldariorum TaxID=326644 RepID=UPI002007D48B|nr:uncharacterized protein F4812DRAFT_462239 [Daldinia caldariorum]KAI1464916.1 hypothetical protein F4812DRAFT_462239 [Daldinia caldariorum]
MASGNFLIHQGRTPSDGAASQDSRHANRLNIGASSSPWVQSVWSTPPRLLDLRRENLNQPVSNRLIEGPEHLVNYSPWLQDNTASPNRSPFLNPIFPSPSIQAIRTPRIVTPPSSSGGDQGYVPMGQWSTWRARNELSPEVWNFQLAATGISHNYGGNIFLSSNQSADVPEEQSTSVWMTNLPPNCTHQMLLGSIRNCGKVFATVINPPDESTGRYRQRAPHTTSASKLVFFDRSGVDNLLAKAQAGEFSVEGYVPRVRMNRIRSAARDPGPHCRVIHIEGPSRLVNERFLHAFFTSKFNYELEAVLTLSSNPWYTRQEWRFGSFRCQAESARQSINREKQRTDLADAEARDWKEVQVYFGVDPCAPQSSASLHQAMA